MPTQKNVGKKSCEPLKREAVDEVLREPLESHELQSSDGEKKAEKLPELSTTVLAPDANDPEATVLELDELWSFVLKKANKAWIGIALCRQTRQVVADARGDRSEQTCRMLWEAIPEAYRAGHCSTDFWAAYQAVIRSASSRQQWERKQVRQRVLERWKNTLRQRLARARSLRALSFSRISGDA